MRFKRVGILLSITAILGFGCSNKSGQQEQEGQVTNDKLEQKIYDEVMEIHNEMMPKMKDLFDIRKDLEAKADSLEKLGVAVEEFRKKIADIEGGEEAMMDWMRNFTALPNTTPHDSIMDYMNDQKEKIYRVKDVMTKALEEGKGMLNN